MALTGLKALRELEEEGDYGLPPRLAHAVPLHFGNIPASGFGGGTKVVSRNRRTIGAGGHFPRGNWGARPEQ